MEIDQSLIIDVIHCLMNSRQTLVFFDSIVCPVRDIVGRSPSDETMHMIIHELKKRGIVKYALGFSANCNCKPGDTEYVFLSSCVLNKEWFDKNCKPRRSEPKQLDLFAL